MLVILAAQTSCAGCNPSVAQRCLELGASDGLLILDVQNAFMEERSVQRGVRPSYNTSAGASNGTLPRGALSVSNSSGIIDTINAWIERRNDDGKDAAIIATLDYHPPGHCSFCDVANGGIDPLTAEGLLQFCLQGRQTWSLDETAGAVHLNDSHRCRDAVSEASWDASLYYQWPIRAVAGTFDARFDPYLQLPEDTVVFKLGTQVTADSYSAFDGGRRSSAAAGMHDIQPSSTSALDNSTHTLETELAARGIKRLFVFGLATDYVVGQTVYNALGLGSFIAPITQLLGGSVVIVDTGVRAIGTSDAVYENILLRDITTYLLQYGTYPDGVVLTSTAPEAALMEFFTRGLGTCDSVEECEASYTSDARNEYFCKPLKGLQWGECVACPIADGSTAICSGAGECHAYCTARDSDDASGLCSSLEDASASTHTHSGVCMCDFLRSGDACEYNAITTFVTLLVILGFGCCGSTILLCFYFYRRYNKPGLRLESTGLPPELTLEKGHEYHLFLSHIWATGQDQVSLSSARRVRSLPQTQRDRYRLISACT
jgi:nicotinamidase-related amidase